MKKILVLLLIIPFMVGYSKTYKHTYNISSTKEDIEISIKGENLSLSDNTPIIISKDNQEIVKGEFINKEGYEYFKRIINTDEITHDIKDNYIYYEYKNEYVYIIDIDNSDMYFRIKSDNKDNLNSIYKYLKINKKN